MSHLPEFGDSDLQSRIDTIRQRNEPRERIPTKRLTSADSLTLGDDIEWNGVVLAYHDAPEDEPDTTTPPLPASVADLYRVLDETLATPGQHFMLKALRMTIAEDSRMLDWLEAETRSYHGFGNVDELITTVAHGKSLREAIKERMGAGE